ncbi:ATP-binding protein [Hymenobacter endophyticus]|uniref:histidine kinase n=1 Tax=Hymenobacter endophyticus TaxID=3076335 RepID=A0ABU3TLQ3_9BACT|nr:PAS domain-containing sensor histidine kinase [Hymenobacter endophyticus]MDU0372120.1 PAS domain-containing sensor histidine kinase [Hymenobacter endophyticus]
MEDARVGTALVYSVKYRPRQHALALRWLKTYGLQELQESYHAALILARRHGCARWLLDSRRAGPIDLQVTQWLTQVFLPWAADQLAPQVLRLAVLCAPARLEQLHTDAVVGEAVAEAFANPHPYHTRIFTTEAEAVEWLRSEGSPVSQEVATLSRDPSAAKNCSLRAENAALRAQARRVRANRTAGSQQTADDDQQQQVSFRTVFDSSPLGQKITSSDLTIRQANPALVAMLGSTHADQVKGRRILDFAHPQHRADWSRAQQQLWAHEVPYFTLNTCLVRLDGSPLWCQVHSVLFLNEGQELGYTTLINTTEHTKLQASLKRLYDSQEAVLHMAAHDVRNPLANIKLAVELLRREQAGETSTYLAIIEQAAAQAEAIVKDVLYLGQLDEGQLHKQLLDFSAYLDAYLDTHRLAAQAKEVSLVLELPSQVVWANLDPNKFGRVVDNLVSNALKFTPAGGRVTVCLEELASRPRLVVQDTGIGIPAKYHAHLFDKFSTATRKGLAGEYTTGLGLFITQQIVRLHGGRIQVESRENEGTTFFIDL